MRLRETITRYFNSILYAVLRLQGHLMKVVFPVAGIPLIRNGNIWRYFKYVLLWKHFKDSHEKGVFKMPSNIASSYQWNPKLQGFLVDGLKFKNCI